MARLIARIFLRGLFLMPMVASASEPVKGPEFKFKYSRDRADIYERNYRLRETVATYEMLEDFYSPITHEGKLIRSMIYYIMIHCEKVTAQVTATEFFSGQMASDSSWVGPAGRYEMTETGQQKYCN